MKLSDAIRQRSVLAEKIRATDVWYLKQTGSNVFPCTEVREAVVDVMENMREEYQELFDKIEKTIKDMELEE